MILNCCRCGNEMQAELSERDWICEKCKIAIAKQLNVSTLKSIIRELESNDQ